MKAPLFWHRFHHADYIAKTIRLTPAQRGAHISLVCQYWVDGRLPVADNMLARVVGMSSKEWQQNKAVLRGYFDADWRSSEIEAEIADATRLHERRAEAGRKGNGRRWGHRNAIAERSDCDRIYSTEQHSTADEGPSQGEGTPLERYSSNLSEGTTDADRRPRLRALAGG